LVSLWKPDKFPKNVANLLLKDIPMPTCYAARSANTLTEHSSACDSHGSYAKNERSQKE